MSSTTSLKISLSPNSTFESLVALVILASTSAKLFPALIIPTSKVKCDSVPTSIPDSDIMLIIPSAESKSSLRQWPEKEVINHCIKRRNSWSTKLKQSRQNWWNWLQCKLIWNLKSSIIKALIIMTFLTFAISGLINTKSKFLLTFYIRCLSSLEQLFYLWWESWKQIRWLTCPFVSWTPVWWWLQRCLPCCRTLRSDADRSLGLG